jgi:phage repressor protein C with HTH and peptisase S24 domain
MKTNDEVRRLNLLVAIKRKQTAAKLAALAETSPAYLSQIKRQTLDSKTGTPKAMGDDVARRIEVALKEPSGWMDTSHPSEWRTLGLEVQISEELQSEVEDAPPINGALKRIPVVGRVQAGPDGLLHIDDFQPDHPDGFMLWWSTCANAYALRIRGESMSPRYLPGEFVGVDPCADVNPSDEVIVLLKNGQRMIKRLLWLRDEQACFESVNKNFQNIILDLEDVEGLHLVLGNIPKAAFRTE